MANEGLDRMGNCFFEQPRGLDKRADFAVTKKRAQFIFIYMLG